MPPISSYCLGVSPPSRSLRPAATTTTPTSRGKRTHQLLDVIEFHQRGSRHLHATPRRAEHPVKAQPHRLRNAALDGTARPDLATQPDLAEEDDVGRCR